MSALALAIAVVVLLLAVSIHLVMPHYALMAVRVLASEVTPWLVVLAVAAAGLALVDLDAGLLPRLALGAAAVALVLAAIPLARAPAAIADVDRQLREVFGAEPDGRPALSVGTSLLGLRAPDVLVARDVEFRVAGGSLRLDRYLPPAEGTDRPVIVVVHGGSWRGGDKGQSLTSTTEWSRTLAGRGFVVYDIQYRLAPEVRHPVAMQDVRCALAYVRANARADGADPERVVLLGRSAGAHLALLAAYRGSEEPCGPAARVRGVVAMYGPTDLLAAYADPGDPDLIGGRSVLRDYIGGTPDDARDRFLDAMPRTWLDGAVPTLLIHGQADQIVYPRHAEDLAARLRERGVPVVHVRLPWSGHSFDAVSVGVGGQIALAATERFVELVLGVR
ncbi:MAG TPA: alpha/beta hydrolase [Candidatus Limnocylindria bacterium]|nr:alpha/beta hydrolase [Candidatus Limnocylindria bacterium]